MLELDRFAPIFYNDQYVKRLARSRTQLERRWLFLEPTFCCLVLWMYCFGYFVYTWLCLGYLVMLRIPVFALDSLLDTSFCFVVPFGEVEV